MAQGWITIGTELATDKFDKQIVDLEKKIQKEEDNAKIKLDVKIQAEKELAEHKQKILETEQEFEKLSKKADKYYAILKKIESGKQVTYPQARYVESMQEEGTITRYERIGAQLDRMYKREDQLNLKIEQKKYAYEQINKKVEDYRQKIQNINIQKQVSEANRLKEGFNDVGSSVQKTLRKVSKLALGIFGIRSAFLFLRRASSDLASYDEQYAANLEYIKYALTQAIAPILRYIVNLAGRVLQYINAIMQAWFGINLFSSGSAENFNKMKASAGGISDSVKEIKKDLLGFDEINRLTDQSSTGTSAGAGGVGVGPDFDLGQNVEIPDWLKWLIDHKDLILTLITAMAGWKVGSSVLEFLSKIGIVKNLSGGLKILAGLTLSITGITLAYGSVKKMLDGDLTAENLLTGLGGSALAGIGAGMLFGGPVGWTVAIALALVVFITWVFNKQEDFNKTLAAGLGVDYENMTFSEKVNWNLDFSLKWLGLREASEEEARYMDKIKENIQKQFQEIGENIDKFVKEMMQFGRDIAIGLAKGIEDMVKEWPQWIKDWLVNPILDNVKKLFGIHSPSTVMEEIGQNLVAGLVNGLKDLWNKVKGFFMELYNNINLVIENIRQTFERIFDTIRSTITQLPTKVQEAWSNIIAGAQNAWQGIQNVFSRVGEFFQRTFGDAWENVKRIFSSGGSVFEGITEGISSTFTNIVNELIYGINRVIIRPFREINNALDQLRYTEIMGFQPFAWLPYIDIPQIPYLRTGAIVNMPNKGTMIGGGMAFAGESGREGVIPLTDAQAMEELGRSIGKYITINANVVNTMNGRVISRELKQIKNEQDFAYNL